MARNTNIQARPVTCGKCKSTHPSIADVKACYAGTRTMRRAATHPDPYVAPAVRHEVPAPIELQTGRYAIGTDDNPKFYLISKRRNGSLMVSRLIGAPGDWRKIKLGYRSAQAVMAEIRDADPATAMVRFGSIHQVCGRCGSPLSDPVSLRRFIGPDCALTMGLESHASYADRHPELQSVY